MFVMCSYQPKPTMKKTHHTPNQIITTLRKVEAGRAEGAEATSSGQQRKQLRVVEADLSRTRLELRRRGR
jgi:hypothetical protein